MSLPALPPAAPRSAEVRLRGCRLLLARLACLGLALIALVIWGWGLPVRYAQLGTVCTTPVCGDQQPVPSSIAQFRTAGTSIGSYAAYTGTIEILFALVFLVLAALLFWRKSDTWMGLFTGLLLVTDGVSQTDANALGAAVPALAVPVTLLQALSFAFIGLFLYIFPDGRFAPHWTRFVVGTWMLLFLVTPLSLPAGLVEPLLFGFLVPSLLVQVYRYRRVSSAMQRQQTKWVVLGVLISLLGSIGIVTAQNVQVLADSPGTWAFFGENTLLYLVTALLPVSICIALLRYRLWDIDTLINRAMVYGSLTGLLGALYAGLIIGLDSLATVLTGETKQPIALVLSTLAIAALFQPLRHSLQRLIDRRFYRKKYDAEKMLAAFSATLQREVGLKKIRSQLLAVVTETMQPASVSLWVAQPERHPQDLAYQLEAHDQESTRPS